MYLVLLIGHENKCQWVHPMQLRPKTSEWAQCECTGVVTFFHCLFLCQNFESVPNVNELMLVHFLGGDFCAHILRVRPM